MSSPAIAVVIVTFDNADGIATTLAAVLAQLRDEDELVVVDNASGDGTAATVRDAAPQARVLEQSRNLGFAGGCHKAAAASTAPLLFFLNPDAKPAAGCLDVLREAADELPRWGSWQALVTMRNGCEINSSGGITHFLGMGWAGECGEPLEAAPDAPMEVSFASGAALVVRREAWEAVGGFDERYFMYGEDLDLGLRLWLHGYRVGLVPAARVAHDYTFAKGGWKWFMLERNRWWTVLGDYPGALLALVLPGLLAAEAALLVIAGQGGWLRAKLRSQGTVIRELPQILTRRRQVQAGRAAGALELAGRLSADFNNPYLGPAARIQVVAGLQRAYWTGVRKLVRLLDRPERQPSGPIRADAR